MNEEQNNSTSPEPQPAEAAASNPHASRGTFSRNVFQRRVSALFASSFVAFSLTAWLLTRTNIGGDAAHDASTPEGVVRMQLDALAQHETQIAYGLFSPQYRGEVPLETFQRIVSMHGEMFRAHTIAIEEIEKSSARDEMRVRIAAADGQHYVARYSTILIEGRWWIDAMRWHLDEEPPERIFTRAARSDAGSIDSKRCGA
jgi:Domain of unknown function (DUF4864)